LEWLVTIDLLSAEYPLRLLKILGVYPVYLVDLVCLVCGWTRL